MQILLSRTWEELLDLVVRPSSALLVLQVVNRVSHRNWNFVTTFDANNQNNLHISSDPALQLTDFEDIANGIVVELFRCKTMVFRSPDGKLLNANIVENLRKVPRTNLLEFSSSTTTEPGGICLYGFCGTRLPSEMGDREKVKQALARYTWFGTESYARYRHKLRWKCLGIETEFPAKTPGGITQHTITELSFKKEHSLICGANNVGKVKYATHSGLANNSLVHGRFGELDPVQHVEFWQEVHRISGRNWYIEFEEESLRMRYHQELTPSLLLATVLDEILTILQRITATDDFQHYLRTLQLEVINVSAAKLKDRQEKARSRAKVYWNGKELMCAPLAEAEVVCLLSKMELLPNALPLANFKIREYTPKSGIDALADYQINSGSRTETLSPVELEYSFENFLTHQHPPEQVGMVICWSMGFQIGKNMTRVEPGLYQYRENTNQLWVIVMSEILGVEVN